MSVSFEGTPFPGADLTDIVGTVESNLDYIVALEYGHSAKAPVGMVAAFESEYLAMFASEVDHALGSGTADINASLVQAVTGATDRILRAVADRTPVLTGRAKGSWHAIMPDGSIVPAGESATPAQGVAIAAGIRTGLDAAGASSREAGHRIAIAQRQVRIAEKSAANTDRRIASQKRARAAVRQLNAATRARGG